MFRVRFHHLSAPLLLLTLTTAPIMSPGPASAALIEDCGNCVDDDADGLVDRNDVLDCTARANGGNQGIGDESAAKLLTGCAKATQKAGVKLVLGAMKRFHKCLEASAACIQGKPGDQACKDKAGATCGKNLGGFDAVAAKLQATVVAKCGGDDASALADLKAANGLGFTSEQVPCANDGGPASITSVSDVGACIAVQNFCRAQRLVGIANPRAREFLNFAGRPTDEFPCIDQVAQVDGAGGSVDPTHVKKLLKCAKTIDKLSATLVGSGAKVVQTCLNAGIACEQVKSGDQACLTKARAKCAVGFTKLRDPLKGTVAKLAAKFIKACGSQENLSIIDIASNNGLGLSSQIARCDKLGDPGPALPVDQCFGAQAFCEGAQIIERQVPRARELADFLNVDLTGLID